MRRLEEIDFIKGVAIFSVLLLHSLSNECLDSTYNTLHIGQAVPLFLFITFYLSYKGLDANSDGSLFHYYSSKRIKRVIKDVAFPFFVVVAIQLSIRLFFDDRPLGFGGFCRRLGGGRTW